MFFKSQAQKTIEDIKEAKANKKKLILDINKLNAKTCKTLYEYLMANLKVEEYPNFLSQYDVDCSNNVERFQLLTADGNYFIKRYIIFNFD